MNADDEMTDTELWRDYRRDQQQRRAERVGPRSEEILALRDKGFDVCAMSDYQFRIDGALDLWPVHRRWHHLPTNTRGGYLEAMEVAMRKLRTEGVASHG